MQLMSSPFKDGTLVVVCCAEETLTPNIFAQLPAPSKLHRQMSKEAVVGALVSVDLCVFHQRCSICVNEGSSKFAVPLDLAGTWREDVEIRTLSSWRNHGLQAAAAVW